MVELPLALPSIVAGIRVATVIGVGTATIAAAIGAGGLGEYIFRGLSMVDTTRHPGRRDSGGRARARRRRVAGRGWSGSCAWRGRGLRRRALRRARGVSWLLVLLSARPGSRASDGAVVIGSKNFTEQVILGELLAQAIEREGVPVDAQAEPRRHVHLRPGDPFRRHRRLRRVHRHGADRDLPAAGRRGRSGGGAAARRAELYAARGLTVLAAARASTTPLRSWCAGADARALGLRTIGDLRACRGGWTPGFGYEFVEREDGYRGLVDAYGLRFARPPRVMDLTLIYRALASGQVDVIAGDATSALIDALGLTVLADDRRYFPPYHAVPVVRSAVLLRLPAVRRAVERLAGRVSEADMRAMNHAVDVAHRDVAATVREFLARLDRAS